MKPYNICIALMMMGTMHLPAQDSLNVDAALAGGLHPLTNRENAEISKAPRFPAKPAKPHRQRLYLVTGFTGLAMTGTYLAHIKPWWSGEKQGFRFKFDWVNNYWLEVDKLGHFYANIQVTRATASLFRFGGVGRREALWIGAANSLLLYTAFELTDAGFADWGFSVPDYVANVLGAGYPLLQEYWPALGHFQFKISYYPSRYYQNDRYAATPGFFNYQAYGYPVGDYDGMTFWLSLDADWMLPAALKPYWPDWLNLALGYGARDLPQGNMELKYRTWYLGLDYNLEKLPGDTPFLKSLKSVLNAMHFPAPALRIGENGRVFYLLKF